MTERCIVHRKLGGVVIS